MRRSLVLILLLALLAARVAATHLPTHRYWVQGRVVDANGMPAMFIRVEVVHVSEAGPVSYFGTTGLDGSFSILVHLHNEDAGDTLRVLVAGQTKVITATFDPGDESTERYSPEVSFTVEPSQNVVPYALIVLAIAVPTGILLLRKLPRGRVRPSRAPRLNSIPGIGRARQTELRSIGIDTVEKLADASPSLIARRTSFTRREAKRIVRRAREMVGKEET